MPHFLLPRENTWDFNSEGSQLLGATVARVQGRYVKKQGAVRLPCSSYYSFFLYQIFLKEQHRTIWKLVAFFYFFFLPSRDWSKGWVFIAQGRSSYGNDG